MSTSEYRSVDAEGDLPISAAELAALANQLFAASFRPGPDSPPQTRSGRPARQRAPTRRRRRRPGAAAVGASDPVHRPPRSSRCPVPAVPCHADFAWAGTDSAADGAGGPAWQRARHHRGAVGRACRGGCAGSVRRPRRATSTAFAVPIGHRADGSGRAGRCAADAPRWRRAVRRRAGSAGVADGRRPGLADAPGDRHRPVTRRTTTSCRSGATGLREPVPQTAGRPRDLRRQRDPRRLPDPARDRQRQTADLVRQRRDHAEAAGGHRPAVVLLRPRELQHPPRRTRTGGPGHRRLRGGPRNRSPLHRRVARASRSSSSAAPPRRSTWWPTRGAASTWGPATRSSSPISSITPISFRGSCFRSRPVRS